jgi:hypothetical protein
MFQDHSEARRIAVALGLWMAAERLHNEVDVATGGRAEQQLLGDRLGRGLTEASPAGTLGRWLSTIPASRCTARSAEIRYGCLRIPAQTCTCLPAQYTSCSTSPPMMGFRRETGGHVPYHSQQPCRDQRIIRSFRTVPGVAVQDGSAKIIRCCPAFTCWQTLSSAQAAAAPCEELGCPFRWERLGPAMDLPD